jgi:hypothetical protein
MVGFLKFLTNTGNDVLHGLKEAEEGVVHLSQDTVKLVSDLATGNWKDIPADAFHTLGDVFDIAQGAMDTVVDPAVDIGVQAVGETIRAAGGKKAADWLESPKGKKAAAFGLNIALLCCGIGEAGMAMEGVEGVEAAEEGVQAAEATEEFSNSLNNLTKVTEDGANAAREGDAAAQEAAVAEQEEAAAKVKEENEALTEKSKDRSKFNKSREGVKKKYSKLQKFAKIGLEGNVIDAAIDYMLRNGEVPETPPEVPPAPSTIASYIFAAIGLFVLMFSILRHSGKWIMISILIELFAVALFLYNRIF